MRPFSYQPRRNRVINEKNKKCICVRVDAYTSESVHIVRGSTMKMTSYFCAMSYRAIYICNKKRYPISVYAGIVLNAKVIVTINEYDKNQQIQNILTLNCTISQNSIKFPIGRGKVYHYRQERSKPNTVKKKSR